MEEQGHDVKVIAREKEITCYLLNEYEIPYRRISDHKKKIVGKMLGFFSRWARTFILCKKFKPDIALGIADLYIAQVGKMLSFPALIFTDTENIRFDPFLTFPFADAILTPSCYKKTINTKHLSYNGYHELAYLFPSRFKPDSSVLDFLGIKKSERYVIIRFVSWGSSHDIGHKGIQHKLKIKAVEEISKYAKVFISSEKELPQELNKYKINIPPERMHDALFYANLLFGESATMASECAALGTPAIFIYNHGLAYTDEQEAKYSLVFNFTESLEDQEASIKKAISLLKMQNIKKECQKRRQRMLADKIDVTAFMVWFVENYPDSAKIMRSQPDYQYNFK
jgi:predicted glycosyltransferase